MLYFRTVDAIVEKRDMWRRLLVSVFLMISENLVQWPLKWKLTHPVSQGKNSLPFYKKRKFEAFGQRILSKIVEELVMFP